MPQNLDFLKPHLSDDLFSQFSEAMSGAQGIILANVGDGSYIPKAKYDEDVNAGKSQITTLTSQLAAAQQAGANSQQLQAQVEKLTSDLAARDKTIADIGKRSKVLERMRADGFRNPETAVRLFDLDKISEDQDGKMNGYDDQFAAIKKSDPYLLGTVPGGRAGVLGGAGAGVEPNSNQQINDAIRQASGRNI